MRVEPKIFVMLLRKIRETNFDFLNTHRSEIETIHNSLNQPHTPHSLKNVTAEQEQKNDKSAEKSTEKLEIGDKNPKNAQISQETPKRRDSSALYEISKKLTETHRELEIMTERCDKKEEECAGLKSQFQSVVTEKRRFLMFLGIKWIVKSFFFSFLINILKVTN